MAKGIKLVIIDGNASISISKEHFHRLQEIGTITKSLEHNQDKRLFNATMGFSQINLQKNSWLLGLASPLHSFLDNNNIVKNISGLDKASFLRLHN